jgi:hypothetical protein
LLLRKYADDQLSEFVNEFRPVEVELRAALAVFSGEECAAKGRFSPEVTCAPVSLDAVYDRACGYAFTREHEKAIEGLRLALQVDRLKQLALRDPWLASLREPLVPGYQPAEAFWAIIGAPDPAFTELHPFGSHGAALRGLGIESPKDFVAATTCVDGVVNLAKSLEVAPCVVEGWLSLTALAMVRGPGAPALESRNLALLTDVGVRSVVDLKARTSPELFMELVGAAARRQMRPPSEVEVTGWLAAANPAAPATALAGLSGALASTGVGSEAGSSLGSGAPSGTTPDRPERAAI